MKKSLRGEYNYYREIKKEKNWINHYITGLTFFSKFETKQKSTELETWPLLNWIMCQNSGYIKLINQKIKKNLWIKKKKDIKLKNGKTNFEWQKCI